MNTSFREPLRRLPPVAAAVEVRCSPIAGREVLAQFRHMEEQARARRWRMRWFASATRFADRAAFGQFHVTTSSQLHRSPS